MKLRMQLLMSGVLVAIAGSLHAQSAGDYPTRQIRMILPFGPGGASDFVGRIIATPLSQSLGQQVIVDYRAGAAGNIGMEVAARAAPDGYTIFLGNVGTLAINPHMYRSLKIDPLKDFAPVTLVVDVPGALVVHPSLPVKSAKELAAFAKARPGQLNFGSAGPGSINRLDMEIFMKLTGINMVHVPYKGGAGQAVTGIVSGEVVSMFVTLSSAVGFIKDNRLRALGIVAPQRVAAVQNVPTMAEQGFAPMTSGSWQGVLVPSGTPRPIIDRLFREVQKVLAMPDTRERLDRGGVSVLVSKTPEEFATFMRAQSGRWGTVVREANIIAD